ncbi:MAG: linear amide C-N hydrolase, partial [Bdellovibrionota bacterium]
MKSAIFIFTICLLCAAPAVACTGVAIGAENQISVGQNIGWFWKMDSALVVNKRGVSKFGIKNDAADIPATWTSKYGSVAFTTVGREFPISGVNEKGLTVQGLHSYDGRYETSSGLPALGAFQWIQYQLDISATIDDAIANAKLVRPTDTPQLTLHFLLCEASGRCVIFQWVNGSLEVRTGLDLTVKAYTNSEYAKSLRALENCNSADCNPPNDPPLNSLKRFVQAAKGAAAYKNASDPVQYLFDLL